MHIDARSLFDPKLIWFGYITCLSQWGGGGKMISTCRHGLRGGGGVSAPYDFKNLILLAPSLELASTHPPPSTTHS
jgi:hypothetical protein